MPTFSWPRCFRELAIAWLFFTGCDRTHSVSPAIPESPPVVFAEIAEQAGLRFTHHAGGATDYFFPAIMSAGCAFVDFDCDGDLDVVAIDCGPAPVSGSAIQHSLARAETAVTTATGRLFRQDDSLKFTDITNRSGLTHTDYGVGIAVGDVNNDGYPDLYFTNYGPDRLYVNQRDGTFIDVTTAAGIDNVRWGTSAAFFDYDRDGWLDLFVVNYVDYEPGQPCRINTGAQDFCNPAIFRGNSAKLFRNVSGANAAASSQPASTVRFEDASVESGIALRTAAGLGLVCSDFNSDGWPDVFVANDGNPNFLWINQRDGTFQEQGVLAGVAYDNLGRAQGSMGVALADVDGNQTLDLLTTNLDGEYNALYLADRSGNFQDGSVKAGMLTASFPNTGFGTALFDIEHDGDADLVVVNGRVRRAAGSGAAKDLPAPAADFWDDYRERNQILLNDGTGRFTELPADGPRGVLQGTAVARGLAIGDVDNDGDLDLLVGLTADRLQLYENQTPTRGHWLQVQATDPRYGGRDMYGTLVTLRAHDRKWTGLVQPGSSYLSSHDPRLHFGLGKVSALEAIEVIWPDAEREIFAGGAVDREVQLVRGEGSRP